jgi:hypothetical protein
MIKDLFQVLDFAGRSLGYYQATSKGQAKKAVVAEIEVRKLSGAEIYQVHQAGYGVTDVVDGRFNLKPATSEDQPELPLTTDEAQASQG